MSANTPMQTASNGTGGFFQGRKTSASAGAFSPPNGHHQPPGKPPTSDNPKPAKKFIVCHRCHVDFSDVESYQHHREDSPNHWLCKCCDADGPTRDHLKRHMLDEEHGGVCEDCDEIFREWPHYDAHCRLCSVCNACNRHQVNEHGLYFHRILVHGKRGEKRPESCFGCSAKFDNYFQMIDHLETGTCRSGVTLAAVNQCAAEFPLWDTYINELVHAFLAGRQYKPELDNFKPFRCYVCPSAQNSAYTEFSKLSELFRHMEAGNCGHTISSRWVIELLEFIAKTIMDNTM